MGELPYFPFYPQDFLGDGKVRLMEPAEVGIYIRLLCHSWLEGPLPKDPEKLARIAGASTNEMEAAWPAVRECFVEDEDGRLVQPRLERERAKAIEKREKARKAARARWDKADEDASADADAMHPHSERNADGDADAMPRARRNANQSQNQKQQQGDEGESGRNASAGADASDDLAPAVERVWSHYVRRYSERYSSERAERLKLTAAGRDGKIRARLREDYSPEDLCRAIDGNFGDDWHRNRDKHDLEYVLRNQSKVEKFINRAERNGGPEDREGETAREAYERSLAALEAAEGGVDGE